MAVYILRFDEALGDPSRPRSSARYYIGSTPDRRVVRRLREHWTGSDAAIVRYARERGIAFRLVGLYWSDQYEGESDREFERRLKRNGHFERHDATERGICYETQRLSPPRKRGSR